MKIYVSTGLYVILAKITVELCWLIFKLGYVKLQIKPIIISNALSYHLSLLNDITFYILFWTKTIRQFELCKTLFQTRPPRKLSMRWSRRNQSTRWTVHRQKCVHLKIIILVQCPNLSMRWTVWAQILVRCRNGQVGGWTVRRRPSSSEEACFRPNFID